MSHTKPFEAHACRCCKRHTPRPVYTEGHHVFPRYLQEQVYGDEVVRDGTLEYLCPTAHRAVHAVIDATLEGRKPPRVGRRVRAVALDGVARYRRALAVRVQ
jgi:hypothetical protein